MKVIERYIAEVRNSMFLIPKAKKEDILRELEEEIRAEADEKESELGRGLSDSEADAIVQRFGHPLLVAARYRPAGGSFSFGRQLIGPELFPLYVLILAINVAIAAVAMAIITIATGEPLTLSSAAWHLGVQFAIVTAIFAAVDLSVRRSVQKGFSMLDSQRVVEKNRVSRSNAFAELLITLFFANIWLDLPWYPETVRFARGVEWAPGTVWNHFHATFFVPMLVVFGASMAVSFAYLIDPYRSRRRLYLSAFGNLAFAAMVAVTASVHWDSVMSQLARMRSGAAMTQAEKVASSTDITVMSVLAIFAVVAVIESLYEISRASRIRDSGGAPETAMPTAAI